LVAFSTENRWPVFLKMALRPDPFESPGKWGVPATVFYSDRDVLQQLRGGRSRFGPPQATPGHDACAAFLRKEAEDEVVSREGRGPLFSQSA
jgi:hypothetical protein